MGAGQGPAEKRSDPDDVQSMVRFLLYTNDFDVEGLVASSATLANVAKKQNILDILDLYDRVDENLRRHDPRYPTAEKLRSVTWEGRSGTYGKPAEEIVGEGKDSEASEAIIRLVDRPDPRPVWFCVWGGSCDLAQAIWKVRATRSPAELERFLGKLRDLPDREAGRLGAVAARLVPGPVRDPLGEELHGHVLEHARLRPEARGPGVGQRAHSQRTRSRWAPAIRRAGRIRGPRGSSRGTRPRSCTWPARCAG